jgi:hypothetical protein
MFGLRHTPESTRNYIFVHDYLKMDQKIYSLEVLKNIIVNIAGEQKQSTPAPSIDPKTNS